MTESNPSERELDVLKILWERGECKVREVHEALNAQQPTAFTTVQTFLRIMADKKLVKQRAVGRTLYYKPIHTLEQVTTRFLKRVFDGAFDKLVLNLLHAEDISADEMRELEILIATKRAQKLKSETEAKE